MVQKDLRTLRQLLREVVARLGRSNRELEDLLGIGHGNFGRLLDGTLELRVRHLLALAELMEVAPGDLLTLGSPETTQAATRRLQDVVAWGRPDGDGRAAEHRGALPATVEELRDMLRAEIRRELARSGRRGRAARERDPQDSD